MKDKNKNNNDHLLQWGKELQKVLTNTDNYKIVFLYFFFLFLLDFSGVMNLYGQNYVRRCINMARRRDPLTYQSKLKPFCRLETNFLHPQEVQRLQSINIPDKKDMAWFSRKHTTTHQCCQYFSEEEQEIIKNISKKCKASYEEVIGKKLFDWPEEKSTFYVYHGSSSQHLWHVDPQNVSSIYNLIICVERIGDISPFQYKCEKGDIHTFHMQEGDAILFNGGTTVHQIPPNKDPNSKRKVISIAFSTDADAFKNPNFSKNMCTFIEGGNNYRNVLTLFVATVFINFVISFFANVQKLDNLFLALCLALTLLIVKYVPLYTTIGVGSGRSSSIGYNLMILLILIISTISIKGGCLFFMYFALSDVFFRRKWVEYD